MENSTLTMLRQRLEILYQMVDKLEKEESSTTSYTKEQIDSLLAGKADVSDLSNFYTKNETDEKIKNTFPIMSEAEYEALEEKTAPVYFTYD